MKKLIKNFFSKSTLIVIFATLLFLFLTIFILRFNAIKKENEALKSEMQEIKKAEKDEKDMLKKNAISELSEENKNNSNSENLSNSQLNLSKVEAIIDSVKNRKYSSKFQCFDFSEVEKSLLNSAGIESKIDIVTGGKNQLHAVISLQIEPQTGEFVYYSPSQLVDQCTERNTELEYSCENGSVVTNSSGVNFYKRNSVE